MSDGFILVLKKQKTLLHLLQKLENGAINQVLFAKKLKFNFLIFLKTATEVVQISRKSLRCNT